MAFYEPQVRKQLQDLLNDASPNSSPELHHRLIYELDRAAVQVFENYERHRGGALNKQRSKIKKLNSFNVVLGKIIDKLNDDDIKDALDEYGVGFSSRAAQNLDNILQAALFYQLRNDYTPGGIKSEGGKGKAEKFRDASPELANACFDDFLIIASSIWYKATALKQKPAKNGEYPAGPYSKFMFEATLPVCHKFNSFHPSLISDSWASIMQRLNDRNRLGVKYIKLINP